MQPTGNQSSPINVSASGTTLIALSQGGQSVRVCKVMFSASVAVNFKLQSVTPQGVARDITGPFQNVITFCYDFGGELATDPGSNLAINLNTTSNVGGYVTYYEQ